jgi:Uma2 family endonuclease
MSAEDPMPSSPAGAPARLTYADLLLLPDDGKRHEIIDGVHYVTAAPNVRHQVVVGRLYIDVCAHLKEHPASGHAFLAPFDVVLSDFDVVEPDLLFIAHDHLGILTDANAQGPPTLVVEVLSPSTRKRDVQIKRRLFERTGVREYWIVDPELDTVQVFRPTADGKLTREAELAAENDETLTTPLLPGLSIALRELLREGY